MARKTIQLNTFIKQYWQGGGDGRVPGEGADGGGAALRAAAGGGQRGLRGQEPRHPLLRQAQQTAPGDEAQHVSRRLLHVITPKLSACL